MARELIRFCGDSTQDCPTPIDSSNEGTNPSGGMKPNAARKGSAMDASVAVRKVVANRLLALTIGFAAVLAGTMPALSTDLEDPLSPLASAEGSMLCFRRDYSPEHLAQHPKQTTKTVLLDLPAGLLPPGFRHRRADPAHGHSEADRGRLTSRFEGANHPAVFPFSSRIAGISLFENFDNKPVRAFGLHGPRAPYRNRARAATS